MLFRSPATAHVILKHDVAIAVVVVADLLQQVVAGADAVLGTGERMQQVELDRRERQRCIAQQAQRRGDKAPASVGALDTQRHGLVDPADHEAGENARLEVEQPEERVGMPPDDRLGMVDRDLFDERLGAGAAGCSEDSELWYRVLADGWSVDLRINQGAGAFVCGESTALTASIEGHRGMPRGKHIRTVEGLAPAPGRLSVLQEAFRRHHALQCGFCTAGILMSATQFLSEHPQPTEHEVREMLSGHLCRCTGYQPIVDATLATARERSAKS